MRLKTQRKAIYVAMGLTVLALVGGYSAASFGLGSSQTAQQGTETIAIGAVQGLGSTVTVSLSLLNQSVSDTGGCATPAGCDVATQGATDCVGTILGGPAACLGGTFVEEVTLSTTAGTQFSGTVAITVVVSTGGTIYTGTTLNYTENAAPSASTTIVQEFVIGTATDGANPISAISVIATES